MLEKKIIVTGGTYGMGASIVRALVAANASVALMARSADLGRQQVTELSREKKGAIEFYQCDVSIRSEVKDAFAAAVAEMGGLDALVHVAGVEAGAKPEEESDEQWDYLFNVNAKGTFITNQEAFPHLKERGGRILNFGAGAGITGGAGIAAYSASKGAVAAWTRSVAQAWGTYDITVNCICPAVWTPMYDEHRARLSPEELRDHDARMAQLIRIGGKLGDPDRDLAPIILFLCSDEARYMTGQIFSIDGGALMVR
jgi:NAD(P)-dependent dehydrogenase (short-subunit alcohol dehydrogenase family)